MKNNTNLFILVIILILPIITSMTGFSQVRNTVSNTEDILTEVEFIGKPIRKFIDFDSDGLLDIIWFDQKINVTIAGPSYIENQGPIVDYWNDSGGQLEQAPTGVGMDTSYYELSEGISNISYWVTFGLAGNFIINNDHVNLTWIPRLTPIYHNLTKGIEIEGDPGNVIINQTTLISNYRGHGITSSLQVSLSRNIDHDRNVGDSFTWDIQTKMSSFTSGLGMSVFDKNTSVDVKISNLTGYFQTQAKFNGGDWSNSTISGLPYSALFIPKNANASTVFAYMKDLMSTYHGQSILYSGTFKEKTFIDSSFVGYNATVQYDSLMGFNVTVEASLVYHLPSGLLRFFGIDQFANNTLYNSDYISLRSSAVGWPEWTKGDSSTTLPSTTTSTSTASPSDTSSTGTSEQTTSTAPNIPILAILITLLLLPIIRRKKNN